MPISMRFWTACPSMWNVAISPRLPRHGTTYEASCYTDPLGIEHLTGSLAKAIRHFGEWKAPVQLRFTTKYDNVDSLLALAHSNHTRIRFSINSAPVARFEGGTAIMPARLN